MAIEGQQKTIQITPTTRSRVIQRMAPYGGAPSITAHREVVEVRSDGKVDHSSAPEVTRSIGSVLKESHTCSDGTVVKVSHMVEAIPALIDKWEIEDKAEQVE